jgi:pyruvate dehydrogenase E1 component alpha subunit
LIPHEKLLEMYTAMVKCRMIADRANLLAQQGRIPTALAATMGHEATFAGIAANLHPDDSVNASHGELLPGYLRGAPLTAIFSSFAPNGNGHAPSAPNDATAATAGDPLLSACEAARAHKARKTGKVSVVFCAGEQASPASWKRHLSLAARRELPVVFVLRHNESQVASALGSAGDAPQALAHGAPVIAVDGDDAVAVYRVASESVARARQRRGPTLIESVTTASSPAAQNGASGNGHNTVSAAFLNMENYLSGKGLFDPILRPQIEADFRLELDAATRFLNG